MCRVANSWKVIEAVLKEHAHLTYKALRCPASQRQIDRLQDKLETKLPGDLLASLEIHDGMNSAGGGGCDFINYMTLLPIAKRLFAD